MDTILENNGEVAIVRGGYQPLYENQHTVFDENLGSFWVIERESFKTHYPTRASFIEAYPVGKQINILGQVQP